MRGLFAVFDHEVETVEDVGLGGAAVEVEEKQVELRIYLFEAFLHPLRDDMVGYAAERLEADHVVDTVFGQMTDFAGQEPSLAEITGHVHHLLSQTRIFIYMRQRTIEGKWRTDLVKLLDHLI